MNNNGQVPEKTPAIDQLTGALRTAFAAIRSESVSETALGRVLDRARSIETLGAQPQARGRYDGEYAPARIEFDNTVPFAVQPAGRASFWERMAARCPRRIAWSGGLAACAALLMLALCLSGPAGANLAFAAVQEQVQKTRSVTYLETRLPSAAGNSPENRRVMILGRYLHREEVDEKWERGMTLPRWISISDLEKGKYVILTPSEKRLVILTTQVTLNPEGGVKNEEELRPQPEADLYQKIRDIPAEATTRLPERTINDKRVVGFYYEETKGSNTWKRTFWVDPATRLPVRIEISHRSAAPNTGPSDWVQSDFQFDHELDKSLFSTEPPEGYTVESTKLHGIEIP